MPYERDRSSARQRGYTPRWDKAAATFKQRNPWCLGCQAIGLQVRCDVVDHVEPHKGNQAKFWNTRMWQPACGHHHNVVKKLLERQFDEGLIGLADLWLDSAPAIALSKRNPPQQTFAADGWPAKDAHRDGGESKV